MKKVQKNFETLMSAMNDMNRLLSPLESIYFFRITHNLKIKDIAEVIGCTPKELREAEENKRDLSIQYGPILEVIESVIKRILQDKAPMPEPIELIPILEDACAKNEKLEKSQKAATNKIRLEIKQLTELLTQLYQLPSIKANIPTSMSLDAYIINNSRYQELQTELMMQNIILETTQWKLTLLKDRLSKPFLGDEDNDEDH